MDDTERILGKLEGQAEETVRQLTALFRKLDTMADDAQKAAGQIRLLTEQNGQLAARVAAMEPIVSDYKSLKLKGLGVLGVIALLGSGAGAGITKVFHLFGVGQ